MKISVSGTGLPGCRGKWPLNECRGDDWSVYEFDVWQMLDIGSLSHDMTADSGSILLSTGPLSMTVDADSLAAVATSSDADDLGVAASSAVAMAMTAGRHLAGKWPPRGADRPIACQLCSLDRNIFANLRQAGSPKFPGEKSRCGKRKALALTHFSAFAVEFCV